MDDWNRNQHGRSGLSARVLASTVDVAAAERETLRFLETWLEPGRSPMCGNSVCQDRRFLARHMPALERFFHYRNLDVSTLKELALRWRRRSQRGFARTPVTSRWMTCASRSASCSTIANGCYARSSPPHFGESLARNIQVSTTVSGFNDRLSMPCSTSQRASSG